MGLIKLFLVLTLTVLGIYGDCSEKIYRYPDKNINITGVNELYLKISIEPDFLKRIQNDSDPEESYINIIEYFSSFYATTKNLISNDSILFQSNNIGKYSQYFFHLIPLIDKDNQICYQINQSDSEPEQYLYGYLMVDFMVQEKRTRIGFRFSNLTRGKISVGIELKENNFILNISDIMYPEINSDDKEPDYNIGYQIYQDSNIIHIDNSNKNHFLSFRSETFYLDLLTILPSIICFILVLILIGLGIVKYIQKKNSEYQRFF